MGMVADYTKAYNELEEKNNQLRIRIEQYKEELRWIDEHLFQSVDIQATRNFVKEKSIEAKRLLRICDLIGIEQASRG